MTHFYEPDLTANPDSPFVRDASNKLVRRAYWIDMPDATLVMVMTKGIGANLPTMKRAHLIDLKRERLIDQVCVQRFCHCLIQILLESQAWRLCNNPQIFRSVERD